MRTDCDRNVTTLAVYGTLQTVLRVVILEPHSRGRRGAGTDWVDHRLPAGVSRWHSGRRLPMAYRYVWSAGGPIRTSRRPWSRSAQADRCSGITAVSSAAHS